MRKILTTMVLAMFMLCFATAAMAQMGQQMGQKMGPQNIVQTATDAGSFKTLVTAVKAAGLGDTLSTGGPFTVFAPNDAAFGKLPAGTVESLVNDKPKLTGILKYHVVQGKYKAADLAKMDSIKALDGKMLMITKQADGSIMIDNAKVVGADVPASNGVIHVIDAVLIPK